MCARRLPVPRPGQVLGLVGTNGIGKSTALKVLAGKLKPNLGRFEVRYASCLIQSLTSDSEHTPQSLSLCAHSSLDPLITECQLCVLGVHPPCTAHLIAITGEAGQGFCCGCSIGLVNGAAPI
jgi:energy-coupling factor transporter ATP-binding protein EcfA2